MKIALSVLALTFAFSSITFADDAGRFAPLTEFELADGRDVIADVNGKVAYTFDVDDTNVSNCYDSCAKAWPPILVESTVELKAPMGTTTRKDGNLQLTLDKMPLYFFAGDQGPGDIKGDGLGGVWHIIID
jgi:predicted lipoprotein with Yx(FWY)xxD motif